MLSDQAHLTVSRLKKLSEKNGKKLMKKPAGDLLPIDLTASPVAAPEWMTRCYRNNRYTVMINDNAERSGLLAIKAMVRQHDGLPIKNHWREMQNIKNAIFGREAEAVEFYPKESELVDVANVYWLWVFVEGKNDEK